MDDVTVVDPVRLAPDQALHGCNTLAFVVKLDDVGMQAHPQLAANLNLSPATTNATIADVQGLQGRILVPVRLDAHSRPLQGRSKTLAQPRIPDAYIDRSHACARGYPGQFGISLRGRALWARQNDGS